MFNKKICILLACMKFQPDRLKNLEKFHRTFVFYPINAQPWPEGTPVNYVKKWLPRFRYWRFLSNRWKKRWWFKWETLYLWARNIQDSIKDFDFVWCIESDVWADSSVWHRLFLETQNDSSDLLCIYLKTRLSHPEWIWWKNSPTWCERGMLCSMYRLSQRAFDWLEKEAKNNRNIFSEVSVPSTVNKYWWTIKEIDSIVPSIYDLESFNWNERSPLSVDKNRIWHAIKDDF